MQIYVGKNGQQLGPFSLEEINRKLADGTFLGTDLAWYEGAAGWAPLSGVPGVVIPPAAPSPVPAPAPQPAPIRPAATPAPPVRPNAPIVQRPGSNTRVLSMVSWILLGITAVISFIPFLGCGTWFLVWPVAIAALIMGIIVIARGATGQGILILLASILIVPICFLGSFVSIAVFGGTMNRKQQTQILENLRAIDGAKVKWVAETKAGDGAAVTMANLTKHLAGKEVKPVLEETYDPMPVGQPPTATLPAGRDLGTFKGGDVMTVATLEKSIATSGWMWSFNKSTSTSATTPSTTTTPQPAVSPRPSPAPSVTVSPSPSVSPSPRPSSPPRTLISPRQSPEDDSQSTGPSPSAKFAPRTKPRTTPSPSEDQSDSDRSTAPRQGRQYPRQSPAESPTPDEDSDE